MSEQTNNATLDDLRGYVEPDENPEADNDVGMAPPPERAEGYNVLIRLQDNMDGDGQAKDAIYEKVKNGKPYWVVALSVSVDEPEERFDGYTIRDWLTTILNPETGSSSAMNLCRLLGQPFPRGLTHEQKGQFLRGIFEAGEVAIAGLPMGARIRWEATYKMDDGAYSKPFRKGMKNFPQKQYAEDGTHLINGDEVEHSAGDVMVDDKGRPKFEHIVEVPDGSGETVAAQVRIARYFPRAVVEEQQQGASG